MATAKTIENKVLSCLSHLSNANKKVVLQVAETLAKAAEPEESYLSAEQVAELDQRWDAYKKGKMKVYDWADVKKELQKKLKSAKR